MQRLIKGLAALVLLLAGLIALPMILLAVAGNPLSKLDPATLHDALVDTSGGVSLTLTIIALIAWVAWATFAFSVLVELIAQLRGIKAPKLPALGLQQRGAHVLVAAVLGMTGVAGPAASMASAATPAAPAITSTQHATPTHSAPATQDKAQAPNTTITVKSGDTLWSISERTTGSGANWHALYDASRTSAQPDGAHLNNPNELMTGWKITVPQCLAKKANTTPPTTHHVAPKASSAPQHHAVAPTPPAAAAPSKAPTQAPAPQSAAPQPAHDAVPASQAHHEDSHVVRNTATGLAGVTALGVVSLLAARRRSQSRRRKPGTRIAVPAQDSPAAAFEADLRADADVVDATDLDHAMRTLAQRCLDEDIALPGLRAARILPEALELYFTADADVPAPFARIDEGIWTIAREDIRGADDLEDIPAPYPCLVTLGLDEDDAWLLLNLELTQALAVDGPKTISHEIARAIVLELVTSTWADDLRITLIDYLPELADALGSDRISHSDDLDHVLSALEHQGAVHAASLEEAGLTSAEHARTREQLPDTWLPQLLLLAHEPTPRQRERLSAILATQPRLAVAVLSHASEPLGEWILNVTDVHSATLEPIALNLTPQHLDDALYAGLLEAFHTTYADATEGPDWSHDVAPEADVDELPEPKLLTQVLAETEEDPIAPLPDADADVAPDTTDTEDDDDTDQRAEQMIAALTPDPIATAPTAPAGPRVRLLGKVEIQNATGKRPQAPGRSTEIIAFLALHPNSSTEQLDKAIWPNTAVTATKRNGPLSAARTWLGTNDAGEPYLAPHTPEHGYRLADDTCVDWHQLIDLMGASLNQTPTDALASALALVDDQPLSAVGRTKRSWAWAETDRSEMIQLVADIAHELATRALHAGDARTATWAAAKGVMVEPASETLWRDALLAAWQSAVPGRVDVIAEQMTSTLEGIAGELEDETLELLDELNRRDQQRQAS